MSRQLGLRLDRALPAGRSEFVVSPANADAVAAVDAWPEWPGHVLALVGPAGSGKSHLAAIWAERAGSGPVLLEDADRGADEEALFHLLNRASELGGVLLTARTRPVAWPAALPDLRSRLNAMAVAELEEPDDTVLLGVLARLFAARSIRPADDLLAYLVRRIERSAAHARAVVARLDEEGLARGRPVTRALAREVLEETGELFD